MPLPFAFDYKNPDYVKVFEWRLERLKRIQENPEILPTLNSFYKENPAQFIIDWGSTQEPRNPGLGLPGVIPFLLWPKQEEFVNWLVLDCWKNQKRGIATKCRDVGFSWLTIAISCALCTFYDDLTIGYTSYREDYVDKIGDPKSFFERLRLFRGLLPPVFRFGYDEKKDTPFKLMKFTHNGSVIKGEVGTDVGRGDRTALYLVDEAAKNPNDLKLEFSLSNTTNCRVDLSTPRGLNNVFGQNYNGKNKLKKFVHGWRDDPRKDDDWRRKQEEELRPDVVKQEIDLDFSAGIEGQLIEQAWINSAIDAHHKLGIDFEGKRFGALDVADKGVDDNAFICGQGVIVRYLEQWSGTGNEVSDIFGTVKKVFDICDLLKLKEFRYDECGLGAGCRGDARVINESRNEFNQIKAIPFNSASTKFYKPEQAYDEHDGVKNKDYFENLKAQGWFFLRDSFLEVHRALTIPGYEYDINKIICLDSRMPLLTELTLELGQIRYEESKRGKIMIIKHDEGQASPNLGDSLMMWNARLPTLGAFQSV